MFRWIGNNYCIATPTLHGDAIYLNGTPIFMLQNPKDVFCPIYIKFMERLSIDIEPVIINPGSMNWNEVEDYVEWLAKEMYPKMF